MKPTEIELKQALDEAERMREADADQHHLAKSLIYLHQRNAALEPMLEHLEKYLNFGLPVEEHSALVRMVDEIREQEDTINDSKGFGL